LATYSFGSICAGIGLISVASSCVDEPSQNVDLCRLDAQTRTHNSSKIHTFGIQPIENNITTENSSNLFDFVEVEAILVGDEIDGETEMSEASRSTNAVQIRLRVLGEVKVDDDVDRLNVDAAREQIRRHQVARRALAKVVEHAIAVLLSHFSMNVNYHEDGGGSELGDQQQTHNLQHDDPNSVILRANNSTRLTLLQKIID
jgi:hypothetical protein